MNAFHVGVEDVNKVVGLCRSLISNGKQFAVLIPVSIAGEIARLKNVNSDRRYDDEMLRSVEGLSKIVLASKMVNSAVGAITSLRLIRADFSAKRAACVRKPAGEASFSYTVALSVKFPS
jgi:hypothetical protein